MTDVGHAGKFVVLAGFLLVWAWMGSLDSSLEFHDGPLMSEAVKEVQGRVFLRRTPNEEDK